ncbi:hypothetical protein [Methylorubrum aminovorans]|uniref:hypothetical protein n=1 Tax=Methylorubrum aminovorans TaxID=269069 RepID=UPI0024E1696D|nr:hypothetical protein [Methylorubrum aminovorans]
MLGRFGLGVALTLLAGSAALAAPMSDEDKAVLQQQCAGDFTTFCAGLPPEDGPETQACFQKNMSQLSPAAALRFRRTRRRVDASQPGTVRGASGSTMDGSCSPLPANSIVFTRGKSLFPDFSAQ